MMKNLDERIAIITGVSHSRGIGAAICRRLAQEGADIFFTYWNADTNWDLHFKKELKNYNIRCHSIEADLSDPTSVNVIFDQVASQLGIPTILVNNAAVSTQDGYLNLNAKTLDNHYAVNVRAACLLSVEFARRFKESQQVSGSIINMTSGQAEGPMPCELAYAASKGAISAFTLSLSAELAPLGITVNALNPGPTDTGWMTPEIKKALTPKFLSGRIGEPEDAAKIVAFLASEEAKWITGQVINAEGGFQRG